MSFATVRERDSKYRNRIVRRMARLMVLLQSRRYMPSVAEMAAHCDCCDRTIRRYVAALEEAHYVLPMQKDEAA